MDTRAYNVIGKAMRDPDELVIQLRYTDKAGVVTERIVSPIRWVSKDAFLALCLCRETPRRFDLSRCSHVSLMRASDVLMPVEIRTLEPAVAISLDPSCSMPAFAMA